MELSTKIITTITALLSMVNGISQEIHVDQLGYGKTAKKIFKTNFEDVDFQIIDADNHVVFEGIITGPIYDTPADEEVWSGDFSSFSEIGMFRVKIGGIKSPEFRVGNNIHGGLLKTMLRGIYVSRCSQEVKDAFVPHPACHLNAGKKRKVDGVLIADDRNVLGGWHNGGDYRRSTISHAQAVNRMLEVIELFPHAFNDLDSGLHPSERIDDWPDIYIEAKWGLDWLIKMMGAKGGVSIGLGPLTQSFPGGVGPDKDETSYYIGDVYAANTGKTGAVLARASRVYEEYDSIFSELCQNKAILAWDYLQDHRSQGNPKTVFTYKFDDTRDADLLWLSMELFINTGEKKYHDQFKSLFNGLPNAFPDEVVSTQTMRVQNLTGVLLRYCNITSRTIDSTIRNKIHAAFPATMDSYMQTAHSNGYGNILPTEFWSHRHTVGNMLHKAWTLLVASTIDDKHGYRETALAQMHYLLGRNALGKVFVTGIGEDPVTQPHYRPYNINNVAPPGLPVKGPTHDAAYLRKNYNGRYPPPAKAYIDDYRKHWVNEPDIEVMGYAIAFSAYLYANSKLTSKSEPNNEIPNR